MDDETRLKWIAITWPEALGIRVRIGRPWDKTEDGNVYEEFPLTAQFPLWKFQNKDLACHRWIEAFVARLCQEVAAAKTELILHWRTLPDIVVFDELTFKPTYGVYSRFVIVSQ